MIINEELRKKAIKEYIEDTTAETAKKTNEMFRKAIVIIAAILFVCVAFLPAYKLVIAGRFTDALEIFGIGAAVVAPILIIAAFITWFVLNKRDKSEIAYEEEELLKISYHIEGDNLVREIEGDGRRTRRFKMDKIKDLDKEKNVVTFSYGREQVLLIDFYEPSLYETLLELLQR